MNEKLNKIIEKKFRTTYIGAIYAIEKAFNIIWDKQGQQYIRGNPLDDENYDGQFTGNVTDDMLFAFDEIRDEILDIGNAQCRNLKNELEEYFEVKPRIYHTEFRVSTGE